MRMRHQPVPGVLGWEVSMCLLFTFKKKKKSTEVTVIDCIRCHCKGHDIIPSLGTLSSAHPSDRPPQPPPQI